MEVYLEQEGASWAVFRVVGTRIHCAAFFVSRHEAEIRRSRLASIRIVKEN